MLNIFNCTEYNLSTSSKTTEVAERPFFNSGEERSLVEPSVKEISRSSKALLRKFKTEERLLKENINYSLDTSFDKNLSNLIFECENNPLNWPGLHWAINQMRRPDVALAMIELFPEEVNELTPSRPIQATSGNFDRDFICGYDPGHSALEFAIQNGYEDVAYSLLEAGADPNTRRIVHRDYITWVWVDTSLLGFAIEHKQKNIVKMLLEHGASQRSVRSQPNFREEYIDLPHWHAQLVGNFNAFMFAQIHFPGDNELLRLLISEEMKAKNKPAQPIDQADIDLFIKYTSDPFGKGGPWPPLHHAFYVGDYEAAKRLLELGADSDPCEYPFVYWEYNKGLHLFRPTAIDEIAWKNQDIRFLTLLLEEGIHAEKIFLQSIKNKQTEVLTKALDLKIFSEKAILCALQEKNQVALKLLLEQGYLVSEEALLYAVSLDDLESILLFLDFQVILLPEVMLDEQFLCEKPKLLSLFLEQGVVLDKKKIFDGAIDKGILPVVQMIVEKGDADMKIWVSEGIKKAVRLNQREIYDYLVEHQG